MDQKEEPPIAPRKPVEKDTKQSSSAVYELRGNTPYQGSNVKDIKGTKFIRSSINSEVSVTAIQTTKVTENNRGDTRRRTPPKPDVEVAVSADVEVKLDSAIVKGLNSVGQGISKTPQPEVRTQEGTRVHQQRRMNETETSMISDKSKSVRFTEQIGTQESRSKQTQPRGQFIGGKPFRKEGPGPKKGPRRLEDDTNSSMEDSNNALLADLFQVDHDFK